MKHFLYLLFSGLAFSTFGQQPSYKFYYSNIPKVLKSNNDTMLYPFSGGMNVPQFSMIDLDQDGAKDMVVFDRAMYEFGHKLMTYLWDKKTSRFIYSPNYESYFPEMTNWAKMLDYNGDGKSDIFTEVSLERYENADTSVIPNVNGLRVFMNVSDSKGLKFKLLSNQQRDTGGTWGPIYQNQPRLPGSVQFSRSDINGLEDLDGDGDIDIIGFNGFDFSPHYYENWTINPQHIPYSPDSLVYIYRDDCWGYVQFDVNSGKNKFRLQQSQDSLASCYFQMYPHKQQQLHAGSSTLLIDLNNDGIKDVIYGDINYTTLTSLINDRKHNSLGRDSLINQDTLFPKNTTPANFIIQPAAYYVDINNDGVNELLVTTNNPSSAKSKNNVWVYNNTGTNSLPVFNYSGNNFPFYDETIDLGTRSVPVLIDIDKDGDKDLIVATNGDYAQTFNYNDRLVFYKNVSSDITKPVYMLADTNFLMISKDTPILSMHPTFGDLNGDGKEDLIIGDANGYLTYYVNQSSGTNYSFQIQSRQYANIAVRGFATPQLIDLNKDGKLDLVIGNKMGTVQYFQNTGTATSPQFSSVPTIDSLGGIYVNKIKMLAEGYSDSSYTGYSTPHVCDLDRDGIYELLTGCEAGYLYLYTNVNATPGSKFNRYVCRFVTDGYSFVDESINPVAFKMNFGARTAPFAGSMDGDSKIDIITGNMRGGLNLFSTIKTDHWAVNSIDGRIINSNVILFPNPANQILNITTENIDEDLKYEVFDEVGRSIEKGDMSKYHPAKTISTVDYSNGLYFIVFKGVDGYSAAKRFLITK